MHAALSLQRALMLGVLLLAVFLPCSGNNVGILHTTQHWWPGTNDTDPHWANWSSAAICSMQDGMHTYGIDIQPDFLTYYYDRTMIWQAPSTIPNGHGTYDRPLYVMVGRSSSAVMSVATRVAPLLSTDALSPCCPCLSSCRSTWRTEAVVRTQTRIATAAQPPASCAPCRPAPIVSDVLCAPLLR